jgi:superfamily II DNA or RNA helicase
MRAQHAEDVKAIQIEVNTHIHIKDGPALFLEEIRDALTFANPAYEEAQKYGRWTGSIPKALTVYQEGETGLYVPRGFGRRLLAMAERFGLGPAIQDNTRTMPEVDYTFKGKLRPFQERAVKDVLARPMGTLSAPTGSGKTVMALACIAERRQPSLVVVHTKELLTQWTERIQSFLGIPGEEIGVLGNGLKTVGNRITVGIVNSVYKVAHEIAPCIGHLIIDECHRTPSRTFTQAVSAFDARYLLGLSATPWRRDKLSRLIYWYVGDLVHEIKTETLQANGDILKAEVTWRETEFTTRLDASEEYSKVLSELTKDRARNELIAQDVAKEARTGCGVVLVLSDRREHVNTLADMLKTRSVPTVTLTGDMTTRTRAETLEAVRDGRARVLVATGQLIGEGFDFPSMSTLFMATPISFNGRVLQYMGRVLRQAPGKETAVVVDYVDRAVGVLRASAEARARIYEGGA